MTKEKESSITITKPIVLSSKKGSLENLQVNNDSQDESQWDSESKTSKNNKKVIEDDDDGSQWDSEPMKCDKEIILPSKKDESTWDSDLSAVESVKEVNIENYRNVFY